MRPSSTRLFFGAVIVVALILAGYLWRVSRPVVQKTVSAPIVSISSTGVLTYSLKTGADQKASVPVDVKSISDARLQELLTGSTQLVTWSEVSSSSRALVLRATLAATEAPPIFVRYDRASKVFALIDLPLGSVFAVTDQSLFSFGPVVQSEIRTILAYDLVTAKIRTVSTLSKSQSYAAGISERTGLPYGSGKLEAGKVTAQVFSSTEAFDTRLFKERRVVRTQTLFQVRGR